MTKSILASIRHMMLLTAAFAALSATAQANLGSKLPKDVRESALYQRLTRITALFRTLPENEKTAFISREGSYALILDLLRMYKEAGQPVDLEAELQKQMNADPEKAKNLPAWFLPQLREAQTNLISLKNSNEEIEGFTQSLASLPTGGSLIGLGHAQNYDLMIIARAKYGYIYDIDVNAILGHLIFKFAFLSSPTREQFLAYFDPQTDEEMAMRRKQLVDFYQDENIGTFYDIVKMPALMRFGENDLFARTQANYELVRNAYVEDRISLLVADNASNVLSRIGKSIRERSSYAKVVYFSNALMKRWTPELTREFRNGVTGLPTHSDTVALTLWQGMDDAARVGITEGDSTKIGSAGLMAYFTYHVSNWKQFKSAVGCAGRLTSKPAKKS